MPLLKIANSLEEAKTIIPLAKTRLIVVNDVPICLAHTQAGLFAIEDTCSHLGESLSKGTTNYLNEVICPWHSYRFSLISGEEAKERCRKLKTYPLISQPDGLYIDV
ncbi:Rieske (2Fe-2S) protein [Adhaeribacter aquaticus]|uniref:Rieske (2Fe-2S) protein n=1 Tax=Adhaeribacter aquaticus TaxID=299567 RepID=UPI00040190C2|nr:Rieske (2Fe-2S) protein [Adhaeribacter aquaticus]